MLSVPCKEHGLLRPPFSNKIRPRPQCPAILTLPNSFLILHHLLLFFFFFHFFLIRG